MPLKRVSEGALKYIACFALYKILPVCVVLEDIGPLDSSNDNVVQGAGGIYASLSRHSPVEVYFKECKQLLGLGKEQSNSFNAQVVLTTASFVSYSVISYLNEAERYATFCSLFESLVDDNAVNIYVQRLWDFLHCLFKTSFLKIFDLFDIQEEFQSYFNSISKFLKESTSIIRFGN